MAESGPLTWLGHATVLIELDGARLLTDPILRDRVAHLVRHAASPRPMPAVDAVLLSQEHLDHVHGPSLRMLAEDIAVLAPAGARKRLARLGLHRVTEMGTGDETRVGALMVRAVPAVHEVRRHPLAAPTTRSGSSSRARGRCTSPAIRTSIPRWPASRATSTSRCCRSGAGARPSTRATWTRPGRRARRACSRRGSRCRSTGARSSPPACAAGAARPCATRRGASRRMARTAPAVTVRVLVPGEAMGL